MNSSKINMFVGFLFIKCYWVFTGVGKVSVAFKVSEMAAAESILNDSPVFFPGTVSESKK